MEADAAGGVALRIRVDQQRVLLGCGETSCEIYSGGRFAHTALLVCNCDYSGHVIREDKPLIYPPPSGVSTWNLKALVPRGNRSLLLRDKLPPSADFD